MHVDNNIFKILIALRQRYADNNTIKNDKLFEIYGHIYITSKYDLFISE